MSVWLVRVSEGSEEKVGKSIEQVRFAEVTESGNSCLVIATDTENPHTDLETIEKVKNLKNVIEVSLVLTVNENPDELGIEQGV